MSEVGPAFVTVMCRSRGATQRWLRNYPGAIAQYMCIKTSVDSFIIGQTVKEEYWL